MSEKTEEQDLSRLEPASAIAPEKLTNALTTEAIRAQVIDIINRCIGAVRCDSSCPAQAPVADIDLLIDKATAQGFEAGFTAGRRSLSLSKSHGTAMREE